MLFEWHVLDKALLYILAKFGVSVVNNLGNTTEYLKNNGLGQSPTWIYGVKSTGCRFYPSLSVLPPFITVIICKQEIHIYE